MYIFLNPKAGAGEHERYGWVERLVRERVKEMRERAPEGLLPKHMSIGGKGDDYAYICYSRNSVRDFVLDFFKNDEVFTTEVVKN